MTANRWRAGGCGLSSAGTCSPCFFHEGSLKTALMAVGGGAQGVVEGTARALDHAEFLVRW